MSEPVEKKKHMKGSWLQNKAKKGVQVWYEYCKEAGYMRKGSEFKPIPPKGSAEYKTLVDGYEVHKAAHKAAKKGKSK